MHSRYAWVVFDADGPLFNDDRAEYAALSRPLEQSGYSFGPAYLEAYRDSYQRAYLV